MSFDQLLSPRGLSLVLLSGLIVGAMINSAQADPMKGQVISPQQFVKRQVGGGKAVIEIFKEGRQAFVGRLKLAAHARVPLHRDPTEEYLIIESGSGEITIEGIKTRIGAGDVVYMPAGAEVSFQNGASQLIALQIFAGPASARKYDQWAPLKAQPQK